MSHFKVKIHQIRFRLRLRPRFRWGSLRLKPTTATRPDFVGDPGRRLVWSGRRLLWLFLGRRPGRFNLDMYGFFCRVADKSGRVWSGRSSGI